MSRSVGVEREAEPEAERSDRVALNATNKQNSRPLSVRPTRTRSLRCDSLPVLLAVMRWYTKPTLAAAKLSR